MADVLSNSAPRAQRVIGRPFAKGVSGNPSGRPVGSKTRVNADFLRELADHFEKEGRDAIERMCQEDPSGYVKVVASLLPKDVTISARPFAEYTDDDLLATVDTMQRYLDASGDALGAGATIEGAAVVLPAFADGRS
jgi:hypothetical protein